MKSMFAMVVSAMLLAGGTARGDANDVVMSSLGVPIVSGGEVTDVIGNNVGFRSLMSELGVVMAPRLVEPADSIGFNGFQFTADVAFSSISSGEDFWNQTLEQPNDGFMNTVGVFARKGIWLPLPSFEVGVGAVHLMKSKLWAAQGYTKFSIHEGYHDLPLPSFAARGSVSRLMGSEQLDLTVASLDLSASKEFGLGRVLNLAPYGGWNLLWIIPRSQVIDTTPNVDAYEVPADRVNEFVFRDQDNILRHRFFAGLKLKYYKFTLALEANIALAGSSVDEREGTNVGCMANAPDTDFCDAADQSGAQQTYTISAGVDF